MRDKNAHVYVHLTRITDYDACHYNGFEYFPCAFYYTVAVHCDINRKFDCGKMKLSLDGLFENPRNRDVKSDSNLVNSNNSVDREFSEVEGEEEENYYESRIEATFMVRVAYISSLDKYIILDAQQNNRSSTFSFALNTDDIIKTTRNITLHILKEYVDLGLEIDTVFVEEYKEVQEEIDRDEFDDLIEDIYAAYVPQAESTPIMLAPPISAGSVESGGDFDVSSIISYKDLLGNHYETHKREFELLNLTDSTISFVIRKIIFADNFVTEKTIDIHYVGNVEYCIDDGIYSVLLSNVAPESGYKLYYANMSIGDIQEDLFLIVDGLNQLGIENIGFCDEFNKIVESFNQSDRQDDQQDDKKLNKSTIEIG